MAFTMSLDDFIITHFTKGPGVDTLSTKIYTEVKKGIKPEMYALSTIIFVTVLVLLLLVNYMPMAKKRNNSLKIDSGGKEMKKFIALLLCGILTATALTGCGSSSAGGENGEVIVYNWGEYIDPDTITMFEKRDRNQSGLR